MVCVVVIGARRQSGCDDWTRGQIVSKNLNSIDKHNDTMFVVKTEAKGNRWLTPLQVFPQIHCAGLRNSETS